MQLYLHTCWTAFFSNGPLIARAALIADHPTKRFNKVKKTLLYTSLSFTEDSVQIPSKRLKEIRSIFLFIIARAEAETTNALLNVF